MTWLVIAGDDGSERVVELGTGIVRLGRGSTNDVVLSDASKGASRTHAEIRFEEGRYVIVDLQSQNGTWVNGKRVERAELPPGAEITIGMHRLRRKDGDRPPASAVAAPARAEAMKSTATVEGEWPDLEISRPQIDDAEPRASASTPPKKSSSAALVALAAVVVIGVGFWWFQSARPDQSGTNAPAATVGESGSTATPASPASTPPPTIVPEPPALTEPRPAAPPAATPPPASTTAANEPAAAAPTAPPPARRSPASNRPAMPPVPRKPNESVAAWRDRIAALEARFEFSRAALERADFGSAASGFEALLREEPGYPDAPALLVQARAGLRAAAIDVMASGNRLDAVGDWFGALQQYERAREVDAETPGVDAAVRRVREKLRGAGQEAFDRGREHERLGRLAAALQEYEKAAQWLPLDDPNHDAAQARADQLRRNR